MKKKSVILSIVSLVIILAAVGGYLYLTPRASIEAQMEKDVRDYLYTEHGYTGKEILEVDTRFDRKRTGIERYQTIVYFRDEPEIDYGYQYENDDKRKIEPSYIGSGKHNPE
ncbi:DUF3139 domain-containing protein [Planococcus sp. S3-L1]|uniref:DUF3139 domain-containing protein n=1 Tax=Planococcus sp. S3-L1 TaxID=3046200 RepID=UPI0024BAB9F5|nr:DUF3139 domain-containing protein [Planococcus sp. S3-L1]MDJ0332706.1 DUF3139 domain-containing protein [Planococcus sp. S3-L1]